MKFFFSVGIMTWTMNWLMFYLHNQKAVKIISWLIVISMFIENFIIMMQSVRGVRSHFNTDNAVDAILFRIMGIFILLFTLSCIYVVWLYLKQKQFDISVAYLWGIRLGLIFFIIFSVEGGLMINRLSHTVGGPDGGPGYPLVNWSRQYGDLRIAHFFGMHALQLLPLAGFYIFKTTRGIILFSTFYFIAVSVILFLALQGTALI